MKKGCTGVLKNLNRLTDKEYNKICGILKDTKFDIGAESRFKNSYSSSLIV